MWLYIVGLLLLGLLLIVYKQFKLRRHYEELGVPIFPEKPYSNIFTRRLFTRRHINDAFQDTYNSNGNAKYFVMPSALALESVVIRDLDLIKMVLVKNFDSFIDRELGIISETNDPLLSKNLSLLNGDKWRKVRNLLSPAFTSSKMKGMYVLMSRCAENFTDKLVELYAHQESVDVKDVFSRFSNDIIATCAFGIEIDSLKNPNNEFYLSGKESTTNNLRGLIKLSLILMFPKLTTMLGIRLLPKKISDFFINVIESTIKTRQEKGISRPDMLQLLIEAEETSDSSHLDITETCAQAFVFFIAGFENISNFIVLMAHELAIQPDVQDKLQAEIDAVMENHEGQPTYDAINNMPYLDAIFNETMRKHSFVVLTRVCTRDFELPAATPDSKPFVLRSGTRVVIPVNGIHHDPKYYENPDKFDPDRYEDKKIISDIVNLGFGLGPRMCIGNRFAILVVKVLIVQLLAKCNLEVCEKTCVPIKYDVNSIAPVPKGGAWLKIRPRK